MNAEVSRANRMKHMIPKTALTLLAIAYTTTALAGLGRTEHTIIEAIKANHPSIPTPTSISTTEIPGVFEVFAGGDIFYTDEKAKFFIFGGNMIQMQDKKNLTQERKDKLLQIKPESINESHGIIEKKGDGSKKLFVFSDPFCPYCQKIEGELSKLDNVTIVTFMLPRPEARVTAESIWCSDNQHESWVNWMTNKKQPITKSCVNHIDDIQKFATENNINSTPTLFASDGRRLSGLVPATSIINFMK